MLVISSNLLTVSGYSTNTYDLYSSCNKIKLLNNAQDIYLIGSASNTIHLDSILHNSYIKLSLNNYIVDFALCNDNLIIVCKDNANKNEIVLYNIPSDTFRSIKTEYTLIKYAHNITFANNRLYITKDSNTIEELTNTGKLVNTYRIDDRINSVISSYNNDVYLLSEGGLYKLESSGFDKISNNAFYGTASFVNENTIIDGYRSIYDIKTDRLYDFSDILSSSYPSCAGRYKNLFVLPDGNTIYTIDKDKALKYSSYKVSNQIESLCVNGKNVAILYYQNGNVNVSLVSISEFTKIKTSDNNADSDTNNYQISSDVYTINYDKLKIYGIKPQTTVSKFKSNMNYNGYSVAFTKYNSQSYTSGNVGTASMVRFYNDNTSYEFELSVDGDLTGEGNANTRDRDAMFDYILGEMCFDGVYYMSADLDDNNTINTKDLVLLLRLINEYK